jgi:ATP-dependent DNA ligase
MALVFNCCGAAALPSCGIDWEVVITNEEGRAMFDRLQQGPKVKPDAFLLAFDMIELDGKRHATCHC